MFFSAKNLIWYYLIFSPKNLLDNAKMSSVATIRPGKTSLSQYLTLPVPILDEEKKLKLNFYFHTSLWCLERFYEGLKGNAWDGKG